MCWIEIISVDPWQLTCSVKMKVQTYFDYSFQGIDRAMLQEDAKHFHKD